MSNADMEANQEFLVPIVEGALLKEEEHMGISFLIGQILSINKQFASALQKRYAEWYGFHLHTKHFMM